MDKHSPASGLAHTGIAAGLGSPAPENRHDCRWKIRRSEQFKIGHELVWKERLR